jgi:hypothetical protein
MNTPRLYLEGLPSVTPKIVISHDENVGPPLFFIDWWFFFLGIILIKTSPSNSLDILDVQFIFQLEWLIYGMTFLVRDSVECLGFCLFSWLKLRLKCVW